MPVWDDSFPNEIKPGESVRVKIEAQTKRDDAGEMRYLLQGVDGEGGNGAGNGEVEFQYRGRDGPVLQVQWKGLAAVGNPEGSVRRLEWHQGNNIPFVLGAGASAGNTSVTGEGPGIEGKKFDPAQQLMASPGLPAGSWMKQAYSRMHCLKLREMSLPGTHNSGMSSLTGGTGLVKARPESVQCHASQMTVGKQLEAGARWFDIRPVIAGGKWATGHYTFFDGIKLPAGLDKIPGLGDLAKEIGKLGGGDKEKVMDGWQGGNGQLIADIVREVNEFTEKNPGELVVVNLSHGLNTDTFSGNPKAHLSQQEWENLMTELLAVKNRMTHITTTNIDLTQLKLSDLLPPADPTKPDGPNRKSSVIFMVDDITSANEYVNLTKFAKDGFFFRRQLGIFDSYANTNNLNNMIIDQFSKLSAHRTKADDDMFLLSWTLTQPVETMITGSIVKYGEDANRALGEKLWANGEMNAGRYPNVVSVDAFDEHGEVAGLVAGINWWLARECPALA